MAIKTKLEISAIDKTKAAFGAINNRVKSITGSLFSLQGAVLGLAGVGGFGLLIKSSSSYADNLGKMSDRLGIATQNIAAFNQLAELSGVSVTSVNSSLERMEKRIGEAANGMGAAKKTLDSFNLSATELATLAPEKAYFKISGAINDLSTQSEKAAATAAIFGREGIAMLNMIEQGEEGFNAAKAEVEAFGVALTRVDVAKVEAANDSLTRSGKAIQGVGLTITVALAPYIEAVSDMFVDAAKESNGFKDTVLSTFKSIIKGISYLSDFMRGLEVSLKVIQLAFSAFGELVINVIFNVIDGWRQLANIIPGIDIGPLDTLKTITQEAGKQTAKLTGELDKLVSMPMPSQNVEKFFNDIETKATEAGQAVADSRNKISNNGGGVSGDGDGGGDEEKDKAHESYLSSLQKRFAALDMSLLSENERLKVSYVDKQFIIEDAFNNGFILETDRKTKLEELELQHQAKLGDINAQGLLARRKFSQATTKQQVKGVLGELSSLTSGLSQHNKTAFKIQKTASIASAIVSTYEGATKTLAKYPYPVGPALAALHVGAGLARVNAIKSTSFGSTSLSSGGGGGGGAVPQIDQLSNSTPNNSTSSDNGAAGNATGAVTIKIIGNVYGTDDLDALLVDSLKRAINDRDEIIIDVSSRNGQELAGA